MRPIRKQGNLKSRGRGSLAGRLTGHLTSVGRPAFPTSPLSIPQSNIKPPLRIEPGSCPPREKNNKQHGESLGARSRRFPLSTPAVLDADFHRSLQADTLDPEVAVNALVEIASTRIREIEKARQNMGGTTSTMQEVCQLQNNLTQSLEALKRERKLRTPDAVEQMQGIVGVQNSMKELMYEMQSDQIGGPIVRLMHMHNTRREQDRNLAELVCQLSKAHKKLFLQEDGLGSNEPRFVNDVKKHLPPDQDPSSNRANLDWQRNKTDGEPSLWVGNVGFEDPDHKTMPKASVLDNEFGHGLRFVVGHVGPVGVGSFMDNFFSRG
ncbi:hypothetical protein AK830_g9869 [Neonectria ditissima]|uniref:Uncharacterized protein n=1 Tax=Neonectria ditissima TaxID=78410 RepID=A0A0P7B864_9HYPO|nr:hypothetical protein AK830_g9869 [Neonectria ditissima]